MVQSRRLAAKGRKRRLPHGRRKKAGQNHRDLTLHDPKVPVRNVRKVAGSVRKVLERSDRKVPARMALAPNDPRVRAQRVDGRVRAREIP